MSTTETTRTFQVGERYACRSACDSDCVWTYEVVKRTAKFVTLRDVDSGDVVRVGVRVYRDAETCSPHGRYSMAPTLNAGRPAGTN